MRSTVLIVDDMPDNIAMIHEALRSEYATKIATSAKRAIEIAQTMVVDLILLDIMMPDMDGFEACRILKSDPRTRSIPIIFVTARTDTADESLGFECGAEDYITKPISIPIVKVRVRTHLELFNKKRFLESLVAQRTTEIAETRLEILHCLGRAAEYRDNDVGMHVARMAQYCYLIARGYGLSEEESQLLLQVAPMHDVGKIAIPDSVLLKPDKLDEKEYEIIRSHCRVGHQIIGKHTTPLLSTASMVALTHHERWDGTGYPQGLKGEDIPLFSRILSVADVFDALISKRPYKDPWPIDKAIVEIESHSGTYFDPAVVRAFLMSIQTILETTRQFASDQD